MNKYEIMFIVKNTIEDDKVKKVADSLKALITNDPSTFQLAQSLEQKWKIKCTQSRVTELNQNEIDEILNVSVSWDRKRFGKSFKSIR